MASANDLLIQLVIKAVDLASKDIDGVHDKLEKLNQVLTGNEFERSAEGMRSFGDSVKESTQPLADAAKNTLALSSAITGMAGYMAGQAYQSAVSYESALADLAKVLDGGMESAKGYGQQLNQMALQYGQNGQQLVQAMANFVQAGYSAEEAFNLVEQSVKLMIAGEIDAGKSSEYLVSILKGFKAPASDAAATVDLLNEVSNKYATDVKQLAEGMAAISPIAKQMGFSMSETAGLLTPIIEVYGSGAEAADALKTGLQKLTDTADPVVAALSSIGVSQLDMNGKLRQGKDIFLDVAKAMVGLDAAQKQYVIGQLVGIDQAGRMSQVFDNLAGYLGATDAALNSTGSAMKEVEARLETAEAKGKRAEESFRQLSVTLGNTFKPQIAGVIEATGNLATAFDKAVKSGDLAPLLNVIKPQIAAVENLFKAMANNLDAALDGVDWKPLVDGIKAFSSEFGQAVDALTEGMDLSTVEGLRALLQSLINLMGNFSQYVAGVVDGLEPFLDSLNLLFQAVSTNLPTFSNLAGQITGLATSANQVIPVVSSLGGTIFGVIGSVVELTAKVGLLIAGLKLLSAVGIPVGEILGGLATRFLALNPAVAGLLGSLAGLPGLVLGLTGAAAGLGVAIGTVVNKTVEWATGGESIGTMLYTLINGVSEAEQSLLRTATAEERAAAATRNHARELALKQQAEEKAAEASAAATKEQEKKIARNAEEGAAVARLKEHYAAMGLVWDEVTGEITHQNELSAKQKQAAQELGTELDKLGVDANVMSDRMTASGDTMLKTLNAIASNSQATGKQITAAFLAMVPKAQTNAELEAIRAKIEDLAKQGKISGPEAASGLEAIRQRAQDIAKDPAFAALSGNLAKIREDTQRGTEAMERWQTIARTQTQAALELAKAKGDEAAAAKLSAKAAQEEVTASQERLGQLKGQKAEIADHIRQLIEQARADGKVTDEERKNIEALTDKSAALGVDIVKLEAHLPAQQRAAEQAERMAGPVGQLTRLYEQKTAATQRETEAVERGYDSKIRDLNVEKDQAEAKGDAVKAAELSIKIKQEEAAQAQAVADAKGVELQAEIDLLEAKKLAIPFDEQQTAAGQEKIADIDAQIAKLRDLKDAEQDKADSAKAAAEQEVEAAKKVEEAKKAEAEAAIAAERETRRTAEAVTMVAKSFDQMSEAGKKAWDQFKQANPGNFMADAVGAAEHMMRITRTFDDLLTAEVKAAQQVDELAEAYSRGGQAGVDALRRILDMGEGGTAAIGHLTEAGEAARQKIEDIRQEAMDAEAALNEMADGFTREMAQLRGDQKTLLELEQRDRLKQLEEAHQRAGQLGDEEYRTALARADELHRMKLDQLAKEQAAKEQAAAKDRGADVKAAADSYRTLGDELERVNRLTGTLATADLSPVINQVGNLRSGLADLKSAPIEINVKSSAGGLTVEQLINELKAAKRSAL